MPVSTLLLTLSLATPLPQLDEARLDRGELTLSEQVELGQAWLDHGQPGRAAYHFQEVLRRERPSSLGDQAALGLAEALLRLGQGEAALQVIDRQLSHAPFSPHRAEALFQQARLLQLLEKPEAVAAWQQFLHELPGTPRAETAAFAVAWALQAQGQHIQAITAFEQALRQYPDSPHADEAQIGRADSLWASGDGVAAGQAYREAGNKQNNPALVARGHFLTAEGWLKRGQPNLAVQALKEIQGVAPYEEMARYQLGWLSLRRGDNHEAKTILAPFLSQGETWRPGGLYLYGLALLRLNDPAAALPSLLASRAEPGPHQWHAWYLSLLAEQKTARFEALVQDARQLLQQQPQFALAPQVRLLLADGLMQVKEKQEAIAQWQQLSRGQGPIGRHAAFNLALQHYKEGQYLEAAKALEEWLAQPVQEGRDEALFWLSESRLRNQQFELALAGYQTLLAKHPQSPRRFEAQYGAGWAHLQLGQYAAAEKAFYKAASGLPTDALKADAWYRLALCRLHLRQWKASEEALLELLRQHPDQPVAAEGTYQLAYTQYRMDRWESAAASFQAFIRVFPQHPWVHEAGYWRGMAFFRARQYDKAVEAFAALAGQPGAPEALRSRAALQLADSYYNWGKVPQAVEAYRQAFNRPQPQAAAIGYAEALLANGDTPEAREVLLKALEDQPDDPQLGGLLNQVGETQFKQRLYLDAIYSLASHPRPTPDTWFWLGKAQRMAGKANDALESLGRIVTPESPYYLQALYEMAQIQLDQRAYPSAISPLETLLKAKPDAALRRQAQLSYAFALKETGQTKGAEEAYRVFLTLPGTAPSDQRTAWHHLAMLAAQRGDFQAASQHHLEEVRLWPQPSPQAAEAQFWAGHALATAGDLKGAIGLLQKVAALSPAKDPTWAVQALFKQGDILEEQRQWKQALQIYQKIVAQHGQNANWKADAEARIRWIQQHIPVRDRS